MPKTKLGTEETPFPAFKVYHLGSSRPPSTLSAHAQLTDPNSNFFSHFRSIASLMP